jgi:hypothetical protein
MTTWPARMRPASSSSSQKGPPGPVSMPADHFSDSSGRVDASANSARSTVFVAPSSPQVVVQARAAGARGHPTMIFLTGLPRS